MARREAQRNPRALIPVLGFVCGGRDWIHSHAPSCGGSGQL